MDNCPDHGCGRYPTKNGNRCMDCALMPPGYRLKRRPDLTGVPTADDQTIKCNGVIEFKGVMYVATDEGVFYLGPDGKMHPVDFIRVKCGATK